MTDFREPLREPVNVADALERDRIVRRFRKARANAVRLKNDIEHWNRSHPDAKQLDTVVEDAIIAYCDGKGPLPSTFIVEGKPHAFVDGKLKEILRGGT